MLTVISPSKTLDFDPQSRVKKHTLPDLLDESESLIQVLRKFSPKQLQNLMGISANLAEENHGRYARWNTPFTTANAKQAALAFKGDVYEGLRADSFAAKDFQFAQKHLRILSGLYGVLRPLDLIQAYRLEMGVRLKTPQAKNLYQFWGGLITQRINNALAEQKGDNVLVNLASNEYFKSIQKNDLNARVIVPNFKEERDGELKMISFFVKKARGTMSSYIIRNRLTKADDAKSFDEDGYRFNKKLSSDEQWLFTRKSA